VWVRVRARARVSGAWGSLPPYMRSLASLPAMERLVRLGVGVGFAPSHRLTAEEEEEVVEVAWRRLGLRLGRARGAGGKRGGGLQG